MRKKPVENRLMNMGGAANWRKEAGDEAQWFC
jgi:hypothetical protein